MKAVITDKLIRALITKGQPHEPISDQTLRGFGIRVSKVGSVSFFAMARRRGGGRTPIRLSIGPYPVVSLAEARERARALLRDLSDGIDPRERKAEQQRADAVRKASRFDAVAEDFIRRHVAKARTARAIELRIRRELIARWGERSITEIKRSDVVDMVDAIVDRGHPEAARHTLTYARRLFRWAIGRGILEHAPTDHLSAGDLIGPKRPRQRLLTDTELRLIWRASKAAPYPDGAFILLLLLLGVRRSELGRAQWSEFDLDRALWTIPPARMKSDDGFAVPLSPAAVAVLRDLPLFDHCPYVFTARGNVALNDYGEVKHRLDRRIATLNDRKLIEPWHIHDIRRTFRTGLSSLGTAPHIAEMCLAHRQPGLVRVYDLHRFEAEKRHAFNAWAEYLLSIVEPRPDKVIPLRPAAS
jgi:integrase